MIKEVDKSEASLTQTADSPRKTTDAIHCPQTDYGLIQRGWH